MNKNIIIVGAIAIGLYLFSQGKAIFSAHPTQTIRQKVAQKRIGQPITRTAYIAAARKAALRKAALRKAAAQKRIGQPTTRAAHIAALRKAALRKAALRKAALRKAAVRKAAVRKAAAQKIGKKIGKMVAQNMAQKIKARRAVVARLAKRQRPQIQRPRPNKKQIASRLFPGAERSRIIPYSESSKHSYYGPKSHKLQNQGYMVEWQKRHYNSIEAYDARKLQELLRSRKPWQR